MTPAQKFLRKYPHNEKIQHHSRHHALLVVACGKPPEVASKYGTATVEQRNIIVTVEAAGVIEPETTVEVKSKASGEILNLEVDSGYAD